MLLKDAPKLDLLVVAAHPDDAEISVGGTIAKATDEGLAVGIVDLTTGEPTPRGDVETRQRETAQATVALGEPWRINLQLPNRRLFADEPNRRTLAEVIRQTRPSLLLGPRPVDVHPDHSAAASLVDGARFWAKLSRSDMAGPRHWTPRLLQYWSIHLRETERPSLVVDISDALSQKLDAIRCYQSQLDLASAGPTVLDDVEARARYWGWAINSLAGEPLSDRESIGVRSVADILP